MPGLSNNDTRQVVQCDELPNNVGVTLSWENLQVVIPAKRSFFTRKIVNAITILNDISGVAQSGSLLAIMGASGSGKTTLLNVLTHRFAGHLNVSGVVKVNGKTIGSEIAKISAYVQQDDLFFGTLTVREHLWFQAMLRMNPQLKMADRKRRVDDVLSELGLTKCADSVIGDPEKGNKSISGGERKRLSFASECLTNPAIMFCDEPTTGLDSFMAVSIVQTLKAMASRGRTILCTIHQPSSQIFSMFDNLLLMAHGHLVYTGSATGAGDFFAGISLPCPQNFNPADFYIGTLAILPGQEKESMENIMKIRDSFEKTEFSRKLTGNALEPAADNNLSEPSTSSPVCEFDKEEDKLATKYKTGFINQFRYCIWRSLVVTFRARNLFFARLCQTLIVALFTGLLYLRQANDQKGVQNINAAIFLTITNLTFGNVYSVLNTFTRDLQIVKREHHAGMYSNLVYYLSKMTADILPFTLLQIIFATILYWMVGLKSDFEAFLIFTATIVLLTHVVLSFGYFVSSAAGDVALATVITSPVVVPLMLFSGFMLNDASIPVYFMWLAYVSWFKYANEILVVNQWQNFGKIGCEYEKDVSSVQRQANNVTFVSECISSRCFQTGEQVLISLNYSADNYLRDFVALAVLFFAFRIAAYVCLVFRVGNLRTIKPLNKRKLGTLIANSDGSKTFEDAESVNSSSPKSV